MIETTGSPIKTRAGENYLTEDEEKKLFRFLRDRKDWQAERDYTLLRLARATGLRRVEILRLDVGDVRKKSTLVITKRIAAKGAIGELHIPKDVQAVVRWFLGLKREWKESLEDTAPLFISRKGNRLEASTVNRLMDKWCLAASIHRYTPHAMRHTKAQRILADVMHLSIEDQHKKLRFVNEQLRHKSWGATMIYTRPTKEQMAVVARI